MFFSTVKIPVPVPTLEMCLGDTRHHTLPSFPTTSRSMMRQVVEVDAGQPC